MFTRTLLLSCLLSASALCHGQTTEVAKPVPSQFDAERAKRLGADAYGMRNYVMVILKTGPNKMAAGPERNAMFAGHFANIKRLSDEGKLALAGPSDGVDGWRGIFVFAVKDIEEAKQLTATDPVIVNGEMVAEFHKMYMSAAVMEIPDIHKKISEKSF